MDGDKRDHGRIRCKQKQCEQILKRFAQTQRSRQKIKISWKKEDLQMEMQGYVRAPEWLKKAYRKAVKHICETCHKHEDQVGKLEPHRIKRGNLGGTYRPGNVQMVCNTCHKRIHENEFL